MRHHEYASLFPMMPDAEIQSLAADIKVNGQHDPIIAFLAKEAATNRAAAHFPKAGTKSTSRAA